MNINAIIVYTTILITNGEMVNMLLCGLNKTTLLDYPGHVAATVFLGGCNFRCPFCHNRDLVFVGESMEKKKVMNYEEDEIISFLKKRKGILTGVCVTGGEPTLNKELPFFLDKIKSLGYLVKLDTNGYRPDVLKKLLSQKLVDHVAMDIKNSPAKYDITTGITGIDISIIKESVDCLLSGMASDYEFRTTIVKELHDENDMHVISGWIKGAKAYYLQSYTDSEGVIETGYHSHDKDTLMKFLQICREHIPATQLRGVD